MANFTRTKPAGWTDDVDTITGAQLDDLDIKSTKTINADDGSSHTPTGIITIGGDGMSITPLTAAGDFFAPNTSEFDGTQSFDGELTQEVAAEWHINGLITVHSGGSVVVEASGDITLAEDAEFTLNGLGFVAGATASLAFSDDAQASFGDGSKLSINTTSELDVNSGGSIEVKSGGDVNVNSGGNVTIESGAILGVNSGGLIQNASGGEITNLGTFHQSGNDAAIQYRISLSNDASENIGATADFWLIPQTLASTRTYTLDKTSRVPATGETILVRRMNSLNADALFKREDGTLLAQCPTSGASLGWVRFVYRSGDWHVLEYGGTATVSVIAGTY